MNPVNRFDDLCFRIRAGRWVLPVKAKDFIDLFHELVLWKYFSQGTNRPVKKAFGSEKIQDGLDRILSKRDQPVMDLLFLHFIFAGRGGCNQEAVEKRPDSREGSHFNKPLCSRHSHRRFSMRFLHLFSQPGDLLLRRSLKKRQYSIHYTLLVRLKDITIAKHHLAVPLPGRPPPLCSCQSAAIPADPLTRYHGSLLSLKKRL